MTAQVPHQVFLAVARRRGRGAGDRARVIVACELRRDERDASSSASTDQARLIAELLSRDATPSTGAALDAKPIAWPDRSTARVTLDRRRTARVVGDSTPTAEALAARSRITAAARSAAGARARGVGIVQRYSTTVRTTCSTWRCRARIRASRYVRVALPLTDVDAQQVGASAPARCWRSRWPLRSRCCRVAVVGARSAAASRRSPRVARRYCAGDLTRAGLRLRRRRARRRGAGARRVGAGARAPARRAVARSRAHGSDSRRDGRRRARRRSRRGGCSW